MASAVEGHSSNPESRRAAVRAAIQEKLIGNGDDDHRVCLLIDWDHVRTTVKALHAAFPSPSGGVQWVHTSAAKANPIGGLLHRLHTELNLGVEAASLGELTSALEIGQVKADMLVFDSPIKTRRELEYALQRGVFVNIDNFQELERVNIIVQQAKEAQAEWLSSARIGVRINPQVGGGTLKGFSTGDTISKFGIPLQEFRAEIVAAYCSNAHLNAVHVHVGSQGMSFATQTAGIRAVVDLALEINKQLGRNQVHIVDIGGGLSVNFKSDEITPTFAEYAAALRDSVPELFGHGEASPFTHVFTEFGRSLLAKAGLIACSVEYTKVSGGRHFAAVHAGADLFVRTVYMPDQWPLRLELLDHNGDAKLVQPGEELVETDISGPCCFSMDVIAHQRKLPQVVPGDIVLMLDTGAYYHSSFSLYNLRQAPGVYLFQQTTQGPTFSVLSAPQTVGDTLAFISKPSI